MRRERALKIVLVLVGLLFTAGVYPLMVFVRQDPALAMMMSLYVTLGIFLLLAARNPSANRSLISFTAGVYPLMVFVRQDPALAMMMSLYVTLGIFLLLAARNPSANRSLIAFT